MGFPKRRAASKDSGGQPVSVRRAENFSTDFVACLASFAGGLPASGVSEASEASSGKVFGLRAALAADSAAMTP